MEHEVATRAALAPVGVRGSLSRLLALLRTPLYANGFYLSASSAGAALAGFAFWALVARVYDADEVGLGSAAVSALMLLATLSHLGLGLGLIRLLPESGEQGPRLANVAFTVSAVGAAISSAVFLMGLPLWAPRLDFLRTQPLYSAAFLSFVVMTTLSHVQLHAFVAIRKAKYTLVQLVLVHLTRLAILALMAAFFGAFFGAFGIVASWGITMVLGLVVGFALLARELPGYRPAWLIDAAAVSKLLPLSTANYVADSLLLAPALVLPVLVVSVLGATQGGYFYVAWFLGYFVSAVSSYLAMSLYAEGSSDPGALRVLSRNAMLAGLAVASLGALFLILLGDKVLLVFGSDYSAEGATLLRIMGLAALPAAVVYAYLGALRVAKRIGELVIVAALVGVTTLALGSALLPVMGLAGAGIGYGLGQGLGLVLVVTRLLTTRDGTMTERMRWLWVTLRAR